MLKSGWRCSAQFGNTAMQKNRVDESGWCHPFNIKNTSNK